MCGSVIAGSCVMKLRKPLGTKTTSTTRFDIFAPFWRQRNKPVTWMSPAESITGVVAAGDRCSRCGANIQLGDGICVSCFLKEGLETDHKESAQSFEQVLAEADVPDKAW